MQLGGLAAVHTSPKVSARCFYTQPVPLKIPVCCLENKSGSRKYNLKQTVIFLTRLTEGMWKELPGRWVPLGYIALSLPIRRRRATAARSLPAPADGSGITLTKSLQGGRQGHPRACSGHRSIPSLLTSQEFSWSSAHTDRERSQPRVIYGASVKSSRQRRVRSVTSCDVWVRTAWC